MSLAFVVFEEGKFADGGYPGTGLVMPHRRSPGEELPDWKKAHNKTHKQVRALLAGDGLPGDPAAASAIEPAARPADAVDRLWIVDGTLIPVRDRRTGASSRNYRFSANGQVIIDADTKLVIAGVRPVPGNTAGAKAWRGFGLAAVCEGVTVLADGAYINTGLLVPHRKRPGRALLPGEEEDNAEHRKVRARVEHAFARMKHYKILRDCRLPTADSAATASTTRSRPSPTCTTSPSPHGQTRPKTGPDLPGRNLLQHALGGRAASRVPAVTRPTCTWRAGALPHRRSDGGHEGSWGSGA